LCAPSGPVGGMRARINAAGAEARSAQSFRTFPPPMAGGGRGSSTSMGTFVCGAGPGRLRALRRHRGSDFRSKELKYWKRRFAGSLFLAGSRAAAPFFPAKPSRPLARCSQFDLPDLAPRRGAASLVPQGGAGNAAGSSKANVTGSGGGAAGPASATRASRSPCMARQVFFPSSPASGPARSGLRAERFRLSALVVSNDGPEKLRVAAHRYPRRFASVANNLSGSPMPRETPTPGVPASAATKPASGSRPA